MPWHRRSLDEINHGKVAGSKLLSSAYRQHLATPITEDIRQEHRLPHGSTWADFIALQTVRRAVGMVSKEQICFTAITELRETTEGKTAERIVAAGNEELAALAMALNGPPAPIPGEEPDESADS